MAHFHEALLMQLDYSEWATRQILAACADLTAEELSRDLGASHHSVLETLAHYYKSERFWMQCLQAHKLPPLNEIRDDGLPPAPLETLARDWPHVWHGFREWITGLSEDHLNDELICILGPGKRICLPRWKVLLHSLNHSTQHRGQIVIMLRMLGHPISQNTDVFSFYLRHHALA
jgi:uncharacterized damage-inducible protein DinB